MIDTGSGLPKALTPANGQNLGTIRGLYIGVSGDVEVIPLGGGPNAIFKSAPIGILPVLCQGVAAAGTTATNIIALF